MSTPTRRFGARRPASRRMAAGRPTVAPARALAAALAIGALSVPAGLAAAPGAGAQSGTSSSAVSTSSSSRSTSSSTTATSSAPPTSAAPTSTVASTTSTTATPSTDDPSTTDLPPPTGAVPFPAPVVAPVVIGGDPAETVDISSFYVTPGAERGSSMVIVRFRDPFELPRRAYRISVVLGDPDAERIRTSLVARGGPLPEGSTETWDADSGSWRWIATADVSFDRSGQAGITVPADSAPTGAVWVEVEDSATGEVVSTPRFPQAPLFGRTTDGRLPTANYGQVVGADGSVEADPVLVTGGPVLSSVNQSAELTIASRPPGDVAGRGVAAVVDIIQLAPDFSAAGGLADEIRVDRTDGSVSLLQRRSVPPVDRSSAPGWLVTGPGDDPGAPGTITIDLAAAGAGLERELGPEAALGIRRELTLDDGATVIVSGLLATRTWFDTGALDAGAAGAAAAPVSVAAPDRSELLTEPTDRSPALIAAGIVALLVVASVVVGLRRRRLTAAVRLDQARTVDRERAAARLEKRARDGRADAADLLQSMAADLDEQRRTGQITAITGAIDLEPDFGPEGLGIPFAPDTGQQPIVVATGEVAAIGEGLPGGEGAPGAVVVDRADPGRRARPRSATPPGEHDHGIVTVEDLARFGGPGPTASPPPASDDAPGLPGDPVAVDRVGVDPVAVDSPGVDLSAEGSATGRPGAEESATVDRPAGDEIAIDPAAIDPAGIERAEERAPRDRAARPRRPVADPLGLLGADLDDITARLDRLGAADALGSDGAEPTAPERPTPG